MSQSTTNGGNVITSREITDWLAIMAEIAYRKGVEDAANKCERRAEALPYDQCGVARLCARDVMSLLPVEEEML